MVNSFTWNNYEEHCEQCIWCFLGVCSCWKPNGFKVPGLISITSCMVGHLPPPNDLLLFLCWIQAGPMLALCSGPECIFFGWATKAGQCIAVLQEKIHYLYMASWEAKHPFSLFQVEVVWTKGLLCSWSAGMFAHYGSVMCSVALKLDCQVFSTSWWMMSYGSPNPKRLIALSNWRQAMHLDLGSLAKDYMKEKTEFQTASVLVANSLQLCKRLSGWNLVLIHMPS